ncbi:MAG: MFS transporter [Bacteroidia bacterium]|nr:MFS transporter [Bacteroidia bacterium]
MVKNSEAQSIQVEQKSGIWQVIFASSAGTMIEWYDFYIFGSLAVIISNQFYPKGDEVWALLATLFTFATGFIVRPFGAIVFGRLGDLVGRKYTFLITMLLMGGATFLIGLLPNYETIGYAAPIILVILRMLQGLALGGEYGGAATYIAEYSPDKRRGYYTSYIQTTATLGLFMSLIVIYVTREIMGSKDFEDWGWRLPFLISIFLIIISTYIRSKLHESPLFRKMKAEGRTSKNPILESFGNKENLRMVLLALFGAAAGQGVVWYTGQYYALFFLGSTLKVDAGVKDIIVAISLLIATPFFIYFGALSDKIGRKRVMMTGMITAVICWLPIYWGMTQFVGVKFDAKAGKFVSTTRTVQEEKMTEKDNPFGKEKIYEVVYTDGTKAKAVVKPLIGDDKKPVVDKQTGKVKDDIKVSIKPNFVSIIGLIALVVAQVLFVTMVYGPIAAFLVELFPTRIRYTSMSLPYHIGNGVFGGLTPFIATAAVASTGSMFAGLYYPMAVATITFIVGTFFVRETYGKIQE